MTRYPAMPRYQDARRRLAAIQRPVPDAHARSDCPEQEGAGEPHPRPLATSSFVTNMGKRPDLSAAAKVGEPTLVDPKETDAPTLVREINSVVKSEMDAKSGSGKVAVEAVKDER